MLKCQYQCQGRVDCVRLSPILLIAPGDTYSHKFVGLVFELFQVGNFETPGLFTASFQVGKLAFDERPFVKHQRGMFFGTWKEARNVALVCEGRSLPLDRLSNSAVCIQHEPAHFCDHRFHRIVIIGQAETEALFQSVLQERRNHDRTGRDSNR